MYSYKRGIYHHMKDRSNDNRLKVIEELGKGDLRFEELLIKINVAGTINQRGGISRATLNQHLIKLQEEGKIKKQYSDDKDAVVYSVLPETLLREVVIRDFVFFVGSSVVKQILEKEMGIRDEIDVWEAFPSHGTVEDFFQQVYKNKPISYEEILRILKEEYGDWIEGKNSGKVDF